MQIEIADFLVLLLYIIDFSKFYILPPNTFQYSRTYVAVELSQGSLSLLIYKII